MTSLSERAEQSTAVPVRQPSPSAGGGGGSQGELLASGKTSLIHQMRDPVDSGPGGGEPEMVPVHLAWLRVRREVGGIAKGELYNQAGTKFSYRGVDAVVQEFGPACLKYGVSVLPISVATEYRDGTSKSGNKMRECTATVTWLIVGPMGDRMELQTAGEALDMADKATTKAQSVALRTLLLSAGLTPTGDPDPDATRIDRGEAPVRQPASYVEEITAPRTSAGRLLQIHAELKSTRHLDALVTNELGGEEKIGEMVVRIGKERKAAEEAGS